MDENIYFNMILDSNRVREDKTELLRSTLEGESGEVFGVGFDKETTEALTEILDDLDEPPTVRLLAQESVLKRIRDDFVCASAAAELIAADTLSLRAPENSFENVLVIDEETVVSVVTAGEYSAGLVIDDDAFVEAVHERWNELWTTAEAFDLRTPAQSRVEESLIAEFDSDVEADFQTMLNTLGTARSEETDLNEVAVSLLVAAKHKELLYDVSKWGENVGVASKATFSRIKNQLEEKGLIETESVPIDIGRPRLRLLLGDERLRGIDADELASAVRSMLSASQT